MGKEVVREILQSNLRQKITEEMRKILYDNDYRGLMIDNYKKLKEMLGQPGASGRAGRRMVELLEKLEADIKVQ
jgi:lipid-A-disaccharide synthase